MNWVQINIQVNEDFRYMKIHIFALRWKDEIRRSSQLIIYNAAVRGQRLSFPFRTKNILGNFTSSGQRPD